jgi:methionyl-tRNA formyltransferase
MLVIAYGQILSRKVLDIPKNGAINLHASLLPKYRGAAPINWAIIKGEADTGLSIIRMTERMDAGDLLAQQPVHITHTETAGQLRDRLARRGADLVVDVIHDITLGHVEDRPQDESRASYAPRLKKTFGRIAWDKPARELVNFIRGVTPWPTAFTFIKLRRGKPACRIVVDRAAVAAGSVPKDAKNGRVLSADARGIHVSTGRGVLSITNLTPAGSRSMTAADFLNGYPLKVGDRFMETPS